LPLAPDQPEPAAGAAFFTSFHVGGLAMLYWTLIFLVVAIVAAAFGFGGIAAGAAGIARILFTIFLVLFLVSLVMYFMGRGSPPV
jgi:uncharacterized membrane protein YtjA (UPF0391 family)